MDWKLNIKDIDRNVITVSIDSKKNVLSLKKMISTMCRKISVERMGLKLGAN
jgi:hypothetical protein